MKDCTLADFTHFGTDGTIAGIKVGTKQAFPHEVRIRPEMGLRPGHPDVVAFMEEHELENARDFAWLGGATFYFKDLVLAVQFRLMFA